MKATTRAKQSGKAKTAPPGRREQALLAENLRSEAMHASRGVACAPGLRVSPIGRWPCPGCLVGAKYPYSPPTCCPFEPVTPPRMLAELVALGGN